jgi:hypothetical protein
MYVYIGDETAPFLRSALEVCVYVCVYIICVHVYIRACVRMYVLYADTYIYVCMRAIIAYTYVMHICTHTYIYARGR